MDWTKILVSLIGFLGVVATGIVSVFVAKLNASTKAVHAEVRSNNGRPMGEHVVALTEKLDELQVEVRHVFALLVQHTEMDHARDKRRLSDGTYQEQAGQQEAGLRVPRSQGAGRDALEAVGH